MLSSFARLLLTSTAVAPVLLTYAWVAEKSGFRQQALILFAMCAILTGLCLWMLRFAKRSLERSTFTSTTIEAADRENMGFLLLYLLPLFTSQYSSLNWGIWIPTLAVFGLVTATGYSYHFNPLLGLLGWHFYKVGTPEGVTYVLITKKQLRNAASAVTVGQLTEYIVIDVEG